MGLGVIRFTPWGNTMTLDFALEAMDAMELGKDDYTDFLCLSFSSTDYAGHQFGIHAQETEDVYLRLDRDIARLLHFLDKKYGKDQVLVFLTADHGGSETPAHLEDIGVPSDVFEESTIDSMLTAHLKKSIGARGDLIAEVSNQQVWLDQKMMDSLFMEKGMVLVEIRDFLEKLPGVYAAHTRKDIMQLPSDYLYAAPLRKGIHPRRSGDIFFQLDPNLHPDDTAFRFGGATHGSSWAYDTHVPLVWYGANIKPGVSYTPTSVCDIAPTLAALLKIMEPSANSGKILEDVLEQH